MTREHLIKELKKSFIEKTNKRGYLDITEETISEVLSDLEKIINIEYNDQKVVDEQLDLFKSHKT